MNATFVYYDVLITLGLKRMNLTVVYDREDYSIDVEMNEHTGDWQLSEVADAIHGWDYCEQILDVVRMYTE